MSFQTSRTSPTAANAEYEGDEAALCGPLAAAQPSKCEREGKSLEGETADESDETDQTVDLVASLGDNQESADLNSPRRSPAICAGLARRPRESRYAPAMSKPMPTAKRSSTTNAHIARA